MPRRIIEGVVQNGKIRLRDDVPLPENIKVYVIVPDQGDAPVARIPTPHLAHRNDAKHFRKQVVETLV
jgi:hypothetical protein